MKLHKSYFLPPEKMHVKEQGRWDHKKKNWKKMAVIVRQGCQNREDRKASGAYHK